MNAKDTDLPELIRSLLQPDCYDHAVKHIELIETHISWIILTGDFAYKIKKPVDLGFLDFSTLEKRRFCCDEELRLNSRLAAAIYLEVVPVSGDPSQPRMGGAGPVIEYAVRMVQFPQETQLDNMLAQGELGDRHIDALAVMVSDFHERADIAGGDIDFGDPAHVYAPVAENFAQIRQHLISADCDKRLNSLQHWSENSFETLKAVFERRKADGYVRECHGDMHLRNLVWLDGEPLAFDCLEFNPALRWIDTVSEVAFLVMDLQDRQQQVLAQRFLNGYLERSGDYQGMQVFRFYLAYRALVRAKVDAIRAAQPHISDTEKSAAEHEFLAYLELAESYTQTEQPGLIITRGLSASGKSTLTQPLLEDIAAIRIRSDVERKRLYGIKPGTDSRAAIDQGIYSAEAGVKTYNWLRSLAAGLIDAGYTVIVDAAFLQYEQRRPFMDLAQEKRVPFVVLEFTASADTLRERIRARAHDVSDADLSVLEHQLATVQPLHEDELRFVIAVDTEMPFDVDRLVEHIQELWS